MLLWLRIQVTLRGYLVTFWSLIKKKIFPEKKRILIGIIFNMVLTNVDKKANLLGSVETLNI